MGFIRGFSLFLVLSIVLILLMVGNFGLTLSLSDESVENRLFDWNKIFISTIILSLVLSAVAFFLIESKTTLPIMLGVIIIISSLPSILIKFAFSYFENLLEPVTDVFSGSYAAFAAFFSIGIVLIAVGLGLKFFKLGYNFSKLFEKNKYKKEKPSKKN